MPVPQNLPDIREVAVPREIYGTRQALLFLMRELDQQLQAPHHEELRPHAHNTNTAGVAPTREEQIFSIVSVPAPADEFVF